MKPKSFDYKFIKTLCSAGKYIFVGHFQLKVPYLDSLLAIILVSAMFYISYLSISVYCKLQPLIPNRLMFSIWYIFQLLFSYSIILKHFTGQQKWRKVESLFDRIEHFFHEQNFTYQFSKWKLCIELLLNYSIIILNIAEGLFGYMDFYTFVTFGQWKITTFYMCFLFLLIRHVAGYIRRRYDFIRDHLEKLAQNKFVEEKFLMRNLDQIEGILIELSELLRLFNSCFGSEIFFCMNIFIVYFANIAIYAFRQLLVEQDHIDGGRLSFFVSFGSFYAVSERKY